MKLTDFDTTYRIKHMLELLNDKEFLFEAIQHMPICTMVKYIKRLDKNSVAYKIIQDTVPFLFNRIDIVNNDIVDESYIVFCLHDNLNEAQVICPYCKCNFVPIGQLRKYRDNSERITPIMCSKKCFEEYKKLPEISQIISQRATIRIKKQWENVSEERKKEIYQKVAETNMLRYGTKCTLNYIDNINKKKETWIKHYGVDNPLKSDIIKEKVKNTNLQRYNHVCPMDGDNSYKKLNTWYEKYGDITDDNNSEKLWISQYTAIKQIAYDNRITKYGSLHNFNESKWINEVIAFSKIDPAKKKYKKYKIYTFPESKKDIIIQGYEAEALDNYILKLYNEQDIENDIKYMNTFQFRYTYEDDNVIHRYIPDFYIKSQNLFIEVKSTYTFYKNLWRNYKKAECVIDRGYNYILLIVSKPNKNKIKIEKLVYEDIKAEVEKYCNSGSK